MALISGLLGGGKTYVPPKKTTYVAPTYTAPTRRTGGIQEFADITPEPYVAPIVAPPPIQRIGGIQEDADLGTAPTPSTYDLAGELTVYDPRTREFTDRAGAGGIPGPFDMSNNEMIEMMGGGEGGTTYPVDFDPSLIGPTAPTEEAAPSGPAGISWSEFDSGLSGPSWWKALKPSEMDAQTEQLANLNLLIPLLSPEDQRQVAGALYNADPKTFAHLNPESKDFFPPPGVGRGIREQFQDVSRAESGLAALTKLATATGTSEEALGSGTRFLRNILDQMQDFTRTGQQSRQQYMEMMGSVAPTIKGATAEQKPFQGLARMLSQPFFSTGSLMTASRTQEGRYVFGRPSKELYF